MQSKSFLNEPRAPHKIAEKLSDQGSDKIYCSTFSNLISLVAGLFKEGYISTNSIRNEMSLTQIVKTTHGLVKGLVREGLRGGTIYSFQGIPYAKPPLGDLRFKVCAVGSSRLIIP